MLVAAVVEACDDLAEVHGRVELDLGGIRNAPFGLLRNLCYFSDMLTSSFGLMMN